MTRESRAAAASARRQAAPANFPGTPFAQRDASRECGTDRQRTQNRPESDGVLVVENRVDAVQQGQAPQVTAQQLQRLRSIVHLELIGVVLIILCAALMAKGIGLRL